MSFIPVTERSGLDNPLLPFIWGEAVRKVEVHHERSFLFFEEQRAIAEKLILPISGQKKIIETNKNSAREKKSVKIQ